MKIDHVTYEVPVGHLVDPSLDEFFKLLEMEEIKPDHVIEKGWNVRWFRDQDGFQIHLVQALSGTAGQHTPVDLRLGHFCAVLSRSAYQAATESIYVERNAKHSPRAWLRHAGTGIRVEIRPKELAVDSVSDADVNLRLEAVFTRCLAIFRERNKQHKDSWRREGWRGCLFNLRRKVERAWDYLWGFDPYLREGLPEIDVDDLLDSINYAALAIIAVEEGNRDGKGGWWG
jgi:hypothetical protein